MKPLLLLFVIACERAESPAPPTPTPHPPSPVDATVAAPGCDLVVLIEPAGVWLGVGPDLRCFHAGLPDRAWLRVELGGLKRMMSRCADAAVEVAGRPIGKLADVVVVLDVVKETGFERFNAVPHEGLSIPATRFSGAARSSCLE